jgi:hypothetical protein
MDIHALYEDRLARRAAELARLDRADARLGSVRLTLMAVFLALCAACFARLASSIWLVTPLILFAASVLFHQRVRTRRGLAQRAVAFYRSGTLRLQGLCTGGGITGERFADPHHVYGADLDLFGTHSLFERLCTARTPMGETVLAQWLLSPADLATLRRRHASIAELSQRLDLREDLAIQGGEPRIALEPTDLARWALLPSELAQPWLTLTASALVAAAIATAVLWALTGFAFPLLAVLVLEASLNYAMRHRMHAVVAGVEHAYDELRLLSQLLHRIESEPFDAAPLQALKQKLRSAAPGPGGSATTGAPAAASAPAGEPASVSLSKLATIVNFVEARRNPFLTPLMVPLLYTLHAALAAERWRRRHGGQVAVWLTVLGEIEALESIAAYSVERPEDTLPQFVDGAATFKAQGLGHPLLAPATRVRNDVNLSGETRVLLVSGSNMSGKSTLLRAVGINTVLAMAGAPVCATRLELTPLQVGASIHVSDSLQEGSSRFYAEITRLRQLFEPATLPLLFLLDELLQGTNSTDRRIGAQGVVRALLERGAIGLVSTHDLQLTEGNALRQGALMNVHFQDHLEAGKLAFDFKLREGVVTKSNGIELMRAIGLDV